MDLADDIAYSLHDVEDFHRSGVLQFSPVSGEFRSWESDRSTLAALDDDQLARADRQPGTGLERLRRRLATRDGWIFDEDTFAAAVAGVGEEFVDGVLARRTTGRCWPTARIRLHLAVDRPPDLLGPTGAASPRSVPATSG